MVLAGVMVTQPADAQNYRQLRDAILLQQRETRTEIDQINALIDQYERQLNEAEQEYEEIFKQYENLQRLLALREQKIISLQKERRQINSEIAVTERKITRQQQKLETLIENYKKTMRYIYKNGRTSQLALILSSASVNQMMVRNYYLKKFESFREQQAADIKQTKKDLEKSRVQLDAAAERNEEIMTEIRTEKQELQQKTKQQETNVKLLRQEKNKNEDKVTELNQQRNQLQSTLSELISQEKEYRQAQREQRLAEQQQNSAAETEPIEETNAPEEREIRTSTNFSGSVGFISDEELSKIEDRFATLKGELSWPVRSQTVSEHFGRKRHPVYGTVTPNLGIEIVTPARQEVEVVHDGYVFAVRPVAGYGDVVFVSHGTYKTAYGNLSSVRVRKNTILQKGDVVGYSGDRNSIRGESVFFMLRAGSQNLDPENWLK
jgi:septal ring factor EnvC (AmiA/AmiB activator)